MGQHFTDEFSGQIQVMTRQVICRFHEFHIESMWLTSNAFSLETPDAAFCSATLSSIV